MADITIEILSKFSQEDAERIRALASQLGPGFQLLNDTDIKEIISSPVTNILVARDPKDQKIVGMATLAVYRIPYVKKAYLDDFIVDESFQGQGIGSKLLKAVLDHAKEQEASYVDFTSTSTRVAANKLYEKFGFKKRDTNVYRLDLEYAKK